jgi:hypothetical protein
VVTGLAARLALPWRRVLPPPELAATQPPKPEWERIADELAAAREASGDRGRWCRPCDVKWHGGPQCWCCGVTG